jgi:hypothetical protein
MSGFIPSVSTVAVLATVGLGLAACSGGGFGSFGGFGSSGTPPAPAVSGPAPRPSVSPEDIVGRYGIASYHKPEDRPRTEAAAASQCSQPYVINRSSTGIAMLGHDNPSIQDMTVKAGTDGKTYVGPGVEPGGADDREVMSFDGRVLVLRWVDQEVASRYGVMVLVRCPPPGAPAPRTAGAKPKPKPKPKT